MPDQASSRLQMAWLSGTVISQLFPNLAPLYQVVPAQRYHCSQNAVIGSQLPCPDIKHVLTLSVPINGEYCSYKEDDSVGCHSGLLQSYMLERYQIEIMSESPLDACNELYAACLRFLPS